MAVPIFTDEDSVKAIIQVTPGDDLGAYIDTAHQVVVDNCLDSGYANDKLELIERWLAAHYYAVNVRRTTSEGVGSGAAQESFDRLELDLHLNNTPYGQMAMTIDSAGNLAAFNNSLATVKKVLPIQSTNIVWLGSGCE